MIAAEKDLTRMHKEYKEQMRKNEVLVKVVKKEELAQKQAETKMDEFKSSNLKLIEKIESMNKEITQLKQDLEEKDAELRSSSSLNDQILKLMENNKKRKM